jgi:hypothetical protein
MEVSRVDGGGGEWGGGRIVYGSVGNEGVKR